MKPKGKHVVKKQKVRLNINIFHVPHNSCGQTSLSSNYLKIVIFSFSTLVTASTLGSRPKQEGQQWNIFIILENRQLEPDFYSRAGGKYFLYSAKNVNVVNANIWSMFYRLHRLSVAKTYDTSPPPRPPLITPLVQAH